MKLLSYKRSIRPRYHRPVLHHPLSSTSTSPCRQLLSCISSSEFIISIHYDRNTIFGTLLPLFTIERPNLNYGSPHRTKITKRGRKPIISTIYILGSVLWNLKSSNRQHRLASIFGIVPFSLSVRIAEGLQVMYKICSKSFTMT